MLANTKQQNRGLRLALNLGEAGGFSNDHTGQTARTGILLSPLKVILLRYRVTHDAEDKQDCLTSYLADFAVNEWTGQNVGVAQHGGGWSASQPEDLERKTKKGERKKKKREQIHIEDRNDRGAAAVKAYSLVSSCWDFWASYRDVPKVLQMQLLEV